MKVLIEKAISEIYQEYGEIRSQYSRDEVEELTNTWYSTGTLPYMVRFITDKEIPTSTDAHVWLEFSNSDSSIGMPVEMLSAPMVFTNQKQTDHGWEVENSIEQIIKFLHEAYTKMEKEMADMPDQVEGRIDVENA